MIEYESSITDPVYAGGIVEQRTFPEIEKKERIKRLLVESDDLDDIDLEWLIFSDIEIGEIIRSRVFAGNPYAESALQAKISAYIISVMSGKTNDEILISIKDKQEKINEIRLKFGLTII